MKGETGETGETGEQGEKGEQGVEGRVPQWMMVVLLGTMTVCALLSIMIYIGLTRINEQTDKLEAEERITQTSVVNGCLRVNILRSRSNFNSYAVWSVLTAASQRPNLPPQAKTLYMFSIDNAKYTPLTDCTRANRSTASLYVPPTPVPFTPRSRIQLEEDQKQLDREIVDLRRRLKPQQEER